MNAIKIQTDEMLYSILTAKATKENSRYDQHYQISMISVIYDTYLNLLYYFHFYINIRSKIG